MTSLPSHSVAQWQAAHNLYHTWRYLQHQAAKEGSRDGPALPPMSSLLMMVLLVTCALLLLGWFPRTAADSDQQTSVVWHSAQSVCAASASRSHDLVRMQQQCHRGPRGLSIMLS
jgi:hypothetical protein